MQTRIEDLSFSYASYDESTPEKVLLSHIELTVGSDQAVLILGQPGQGKTTLASILSLITPRYNSGSLSGRVLYDGKEYGSSGELLDFFSLVPQNPGEYFLSSCVEDELASPLESLGLDAGEMRKRVGSMLSFFDLEKYRTRSVSELSGGEKKRLAIASALITEPKVVVFDESFDDLDDKWKSVLASLIRSRRFASIVTSSRFLKVFSSLFDSCFRLESAELKPVTEEEAAKEAEFTFSRHRQQGEGKLSAENIVFRRGSFALSVPSFSLHRGEIAALMGPNGSGKSTFSRLLCALEKPAEGSIMIDGRAADARTLMRSAGYVFQSPDCQLFLPAVRDELSWSLDYYSLTRKEKEARAEELAALFSLELDKSALLMSYGSRKRLQCAIYYSLNRPYYILDEIEAALSVQQACQMVSLLSSRGAGILLIAHDEDFVSKLADRVYTIREGVLE